MSTSENSQQQAWNYTELQKRHHNLQNDFSQLQKSYNGLSKVYSTVSIEKDRSFSELMHMKQEEKKLIDRINFLSNHLGKVMDSSVKNHEKFESTQNELRLLKDRLAVAERRLYIKNHEVEAGKFELSEAKTLNNRLEEEIIVIMQANKALSSKKYNNIIERGLLDQDTINIEENLLDKVKREIDRNASIFEKKLGDLFAEYKDTNYQTVLGLENTRSNEKSKDKSPKIISRLSESLAKSPDNISPSPEIPLPEVKCESPPLHYQALKRELELDESVPLQEIRPCAIRQ